MKWWRRDRRVGTLDMVQDLRAFAPHVKTSVLWRDIGGSEFELLRDRLASGVLCTRVDKLWRDWQPNRIAWAKERLPTSDAEMYRVYKWMLTSMDNAAKHRTGTADADAHCKTVMFTVGER